MGRGGYAQGDPRVCSVSWGGYAQGYPRDPAPTSGSFKTNSSSRDQKPWASADTCIHARMYTQTHTNTSFKSLKAVIRMSLALNFPVS